ncbi:Aryldialkylphosphatase [Modestobacter italicus]|uniref:Aryldialkylphosphatase n=1 Tax=Modestobacter italicus (strain DSM 44449 / CECT 9708 / BC 501) TaxID=2732864 RepID=I4EYF4_MODI5|nr:aryldialkylphosphatase [Modestobacter marinus]CCH88417.1 Aryldialkylphosphatase [Modestobacter marinus]
MNTVLGPVPAADLGVVAVHESLLSVVPGAEHAYDITIDRAEVFETLAGKLTAFRAAGGGTVVDSTGMFHGRDVRLYQALSRSTGVHVVASTGMGPEEDLGGYFLTPQTNPPTPWPAERFADLFAREVTEGMVVPRVERRGSAGIVATTATRAGATPTDQSLVRGAARAALATGLPVSLRHGADALADLQLVLDEGLPADRVVVGGLDRAEAVAAGWPAAVAERGAYVAIDHVGLDDDADVVRDADRVALVTQLVEAGAADRVLLSSNAIGQAFGQPGYDLPFGHVLTSFVPLLRSHGVHDEDVQRFLVGNPRDLLAVR